jgi:hypothetical protein
MNATIRTRPRTWLMTVLALVILVPAMLGFGNKFIEFLMLVGDEEGAFTVVPILNYLLVSLGFLLLFGWAVLHGMFRNIEGPKHTMLENEQRLDEERRLGIEEENRVL